MTDIIPTIKCTVSGDVRTELKIEYLKDFLTPLKIKEMTECEIDDTIDLIHSLIDEMKNQFHMQTGLDMCKDIEIAMFLPEFLHTIIYIQKADELLKSIKLTYYVQY